MNEEKMKQASAYFTSALVLTILDTDKLPEDKRNSSNFIRRLFVNYEAALRVADEVGMSVREDAKIIKEEIELALRKVGGAMLRIELDSEDE